MTNHGKNGDLWQALAIKLTPSQNKNDRVSIIRAAKFLLILIKKTHYFIPDDKILLIQNNVF